MTMIDKVKKAVREFDMDLYGKNALIALSGGADSTALLVVMSELAEEYNIKITCAHLNHMLREKADADEAFCAALAEKKGARFISQKTDVKSLAREQKVSLELAGRRARYDFFERAAKEARCERILTAHTASDNLETVLFFLARGSSIGGLAGIPPKRGGIARPMILVTRDEVIAYLAEKKQDFVTDETNFSNEFTRNAIRNIVVPELKKINARVEQAVTRMSSSARESQEVLELCAAKADVESGSGGALDIKKLLAMSAALQKRIVADAMRRCGVGSVKSVYIDDVLALIKSGRRGEVTLAQNVLAISSFGSLYFKKLDKTEEKSYNILIYESGFEGKIFESGCYRVRLDRYFDAQAPTIHKNLMTALLDYDKISWPIAVTGRSPGDAYALKGRRTKTLKKMMSEQKIPYFERDALPVFKSGGDIVFAAGTGESGKFAAAQTTKRILKIEVEKDAKQRP